MKVLRFFAILAVVCVALTITVSAATVPDIINKLKADGISSTKIAQAEDFFKSNSFTGAQLNQIDSALDRVTVVIKKYGVTDYSKLPAAAKSEIEGIVANTASKVKEKISVGENASGIPTVTLEKDGSQYTFAGNDNIPKTTGSNETIPYIVFSIGLIFVFGSAAYMYSKRRSEVE